MSWALTYFSSFFSWCMLIFLLSDASEPVGGLGLEPTTFQLRTNCTNNQCRISPKCIWKTNGSTNTCFHPHKCLANDLIRIWWLWLNTCFSLWNVFSSETWVLLSGSTGISVTSRLMLYMYRCTSGPLVKRHQWDVYINISWKMSVINHHHWSQALFLCAAFIKPKKSLAKIERTGTFCHAIGLLYVIFLPNCMFLVTFIAL